MQISEEWVQTQVANQIVTSFCKSQPLIDKVVALSVQEIRKEQAEELAKVSKERFGWFTTSDGSCYILREDLAREGLVVEQERIFVHVEHVQDGPTFWQFLAVIAAIITTCSFFAWVFLWQC